MAFKDLTPEQRLVACHVDFMKHPVYCLLGGVTQIGKAEVVDDLPTAGTNGADVYYGREFIKDMSRKQLRYLVGHENMHKALHHCTTYKDIAGKHPEEFAQAIDYVVNWQLESMDTGSDKFLERPTSVPPLIDAKYADMSVLEVMRDLLKNKRPQQKPMDVHTQGVDEGGTIDPDIVQKIDDAVRHGELMQGQMRSDSGAGSASLGGFRESRTDWRAPLRRFMQELCEGDDQSRYSPPNKRMLPLDIILPSHFSEAAGEIVIACDTSGSMSSILPLVFGEVACIAQTVLPSSVRVLWWDTAIAGEQVFTPKDYHSIAKMMAPKGGGGTTVSCVARHMRAKRLKPKATLMLTDGYVESSYEVPAGNVLWGVVGNTRFVPLRGKVLHIQEV